MCQRLSKSWFLFLQQRLQARLHSTICRPRTSRSLLVWLCVQEGLVQLLQKDHLCKSGLNLMERTSNPGSRTILFRIYDKVFPKKAPLKNWGCLIFGTWLWTASTPFRSLSLSSAKLKKQGIYLITESGNPLIHFPMHCTVGCTRCCTVKKIASYFIIIFSLVWYDMALRFRTQHTLVSYCFFKSMHYHNFQRKCSLSSNSLVCLKKCVLEKEGHLIFGSMQFFIL